MIPQMFKGLFKRNRKSGPSSFLDLDEDIVSTDFECSLESLTFSSTCEDVFLDRFNHSRILELIKESGILPALNENGFKNVVLDIFKDDTGVHHLKIYADTKKRATLVDLRLSFKNVYRADLQNPMKIDFRKHNFSVLEWISLENPRKSFSEESRPLPGQMRPGLGILHQIMSFLQIIAQSSGLDGIIMVPDRFHTAVMYSKFAFYIDPSCQGKMSAILRDLARFSIEDISWGFITGTIMDIDDEKSATFSPSPQIFPVSRRVMKYFQSSKYHRLSRKESKKHYYELNHSEMTARRSQLLLTKSTSEV